MNLSILVEKIVEISYDEGKVLKLILSNDFLVDLGTATWRLAKNDEYYLVAADKKSKKVICKSFSNVKKHDFKLFKESRVRWTKETEGLIDSGCTGIRKIQSTTRLPKKRRKGKVLTKEVKQ